MNPNYIITVLGGNVEFDLLIPGKFCVVEDNVCNFDLIGTKRHSDTYQKPKLRSSADMLKK